MKNTLDLAAREMTEAKMVFSSVSVEKGILIDV